MTVATTSTRYPFETRSLLGRVAIITGGSGGIGQAVCRALVQSGSQVVLVDLNAERLQAVTERLAEDAPDRPPLALHADTRREQDCETMVRQVLDRYQRIDILITAAGILRAPGQKPSTLVDTQLADWKAVVDTNLRGTFLSNRAVLPSMIRQRSGDIVNIASTSGRRGIAYDSAYCASKFGVIAMSEALATEVRSQGIRVQAVLPAAVDTPMWAQNGPLFRPTEILSPERVAAVILFLISLPEDTAMLNATIIPVKARGRPGGEV